MKKYMESYMLAGVTMMIVTGISMLFVSSIPPVARIAIMVLCVCFSGVGVFVFFRYLRAGFASQNDKPLTLGLLLRSAIIAGGACTAYFSLSDFEKSLLPSMNILVGSLSVISIILLAYHIYLYIRQLQGADSSN